jgi:hypothetical protein
MSNEPSTHGTDRLAPFRKAQRTRQSASGPGDRIASTRDVAIYFREDCRTLDDALQLEMVVAQYCLQIRDVVTRAGMPVGDAVGVGVVAELEGHGDSLSHAILRGLGHLGVGEIADRAGEAAARLGDRVTGLPQQFADVGKATALGAWRTSAGAFEGEYALLAQFEHPRGRGHALALYVEPRHGGVVKHIGLLGAMPDVDPGDLFHPSAMESLSASQAGELIRDVLERSYGPLAAETDDFRVLVAGARARSMMLDGGCDDGRRTL